MSIDVEPLDISPPYLFPDYEISVRRAPQKALIELPRSWFERTAGPAYGRIPVAPGDNDLTSRGTDHPIGQRIVFGGLVLDSDGRGIPDALIELWQANAAGRYMDRAAPEFFPLDPNFTGCGRCLTDNDGRYSFTTIRPGAYSAGSAFLFRPAHIHVSIIGPGLTSRLVSQMYFPDDPLHDSDPILGSIPDVRGRQRLIAEFLEARVELDGRRSALHYVWDIVLRGHRQTPVESR
jgi:protocatechuate 3,4-dioxygenase beta subunit